MKNDNEIVICAAIYFDDGIKHPHQPTNIEHGFIIGGWRHHSIIATATILNCIDKSNHIQGFLTSKNRFLNRKEAKELVLQTGQPISPHTYSNDLFSEDLY